MAGELAGKAMTPLGLGAIGRRAMLGLATALAIGAVSAQATPYLVVDADSDQVLFQNEATAQWYPASLTKLMTVYVALDAVRGGKLTLDTPLVMSVRASRIPPSKMGFRPGTEVTLDNALKMLMGCAIRRHEPRTGGPPERWRMNWSVSASSGSPASTPARWFATCAAVAR
jgi:hypothetical protein